MNKNAATADTYRAARSFTAVDTGLKSIYKSLPKFISLYTKLQQFTPDYNSLKQFTQVSTRLHQLTPVYISLLQFVGWSDPIEIEFLIGLWPN